MISRFELPPRVQKENGEDRLVGVEIEMSGIELSMIACQINILFGGRIEEISPFEFKIKDTEVGDFRIELDYVYLKTYAREKYEAMQKAHKKKEDEESNQLVEESEDDDFLFKIVDLELPDLEDLAAEALALVAKNIVPLEIVTPPIPIDKLTKLDKLVARLRDHGAKGTRHLLFYAFGVHLNPELPNTDVNTVLAFFRAFLCLHEWLAEQEKVAFSRRMTPYINRFPNDYTKKVISPGYQPSLAEFIDDYLAHNPSRNRALDLLPLLTWLDEKRVRNALPEEKIGRRPTFHYRLPNSDIDNPHWGIANCWNHWVMVERLANHPELLEEMTAALSKHLELFSIEAVQWKDRVKDCITKLSKTAD